MEQYIDKGNELSELANKWKKGRKWENIPIQDIQDKEYVVSLKIDGELTAFEYNNGNITYSSRHGKIRKNLPFDKELVSLFKKYKKVIGFGELYAVGKDGTILPYTQAISILRKPNEDNIGQIRFKIFDIYQINDKKIELPYIKRFALLKKIINNKKFRINAIKADKSKILNIFDKYVKSGMYEGIVVWDEGKTYKIKEFINIDAVVIFVEKSDKHPNRMGALGLALLDNKKLYYLGSVGTGFTDGQRIKWLKYAFKNKTKIDGDRIFVEPKIIVEVNAKSLNVGSNEIYDFNYNIIGESSFGSLREPKFIRIREDKNVKENNIGLSQIKNFIDKFNKDSKAGSFMKLRESIGNWFINNGFVKIAISLNQLNIDIPQNLNEKEKIEKIFNIIYMDPTSKFNNQNLEFKNLNEFIDKFSMEYKGNKYLNVKLIKLINGDFLGVINKFYDDLIKYGINNIRNGFINSLSKTENRRVLLNKDVSIEDIKAVLGISEGKEVKVEKHFEKIAEKQIDDVKYTLYKALSPYGIKKLANAGFSTWCVNSINYAKSYWDNSITQENGFWYIFKNKNPFFAIGGSDGISSLFNTSLSSYSVEIHEYDYKILKEWQPIYNYDFKEQKVLTKEQFEQKIRDLINRLNNKEKIKDYDWEIIFTYSDKIRNAVDINSLLNLTLGIERGIRKGDGDYITKSDLLVFIAKFINRGPFEKNQNIKKEILEKVQRKIAEDFNSSVDYLKSVAKGYKEEYAVYRDNLIETLYKGFDESEYEDDIDDLRFILNAIAKANDTLKEEEKKYLNLMIDNYDRINFFFLANYDTIKKIGLDIDKNKLYNNIIKDPRNSFEFAKELDFKEVPKEIISSIVQSPGYSYYYAEALNFKEVPKEIISSISKDIFRSNEYAKGLNFQNVPPEIISSISKSPGYSYEYAYNALNFQNVPPEIISSISKSPKASYYYAKGLNFNFQNMPQEIIHGFINKDSEYLFEYLEKINFDIQKIPENILLEIFKLNINNPNIEKMKIQYALYCIKNNQLQKLKDIKIKKDSLLPYISNYPNKEEILKYVISNIEKWFITKKSIRYREKHDIDEDLDRSLFLYLTELIGSKNLDEILDRAKKILKLNNKEFAILNTPDGIAYLAQSVNYAAKMVDNRLYDIKNILTRWLARNHPRAYFDKYNNILYVKVGEGQQLSFHVGHDIGIDGDGEYNKKIDKTYLKRTIDPEIKFDGRYRQDLSDYGLYNYLYRRNDILDPVVREIDGKYYVYVRNKDESYGPFDTKEEAYEYIEENSIEMVASNARLKSNDIIYKVAAFDTNTLQIRIEGQLKDDIISFVKRNFLQKYLYYNTNLYIYGRVLNPHITMMYFKKDIFNDIIEYLKNKNIKQIEFKLGNIKKFSSDKDVFYIEVISEQLEKIVKELSEKFNEPQPFKFVGHIALAYVKKDTHNFLLNNSYFNGIRYVTSIIEASYSDNNRGGEFYNLYNNSNGKVLDFIYKHNTDGGKINGNVGFDFDYTLTSNPILFKKIIDKMRESGNKVYIITGRGPLLSEYIKEFLNKNNIEIDGVYNFGKDLKDEDFMSNPELRKEIYQFKLNKIKELNIKNFFDDDIHIILNLPKDVNKYYVPALSQKISNGKFVYPEKNNNKFEHIINKLLYVANKYGYKIYAAGGYVRDLIMDRDSKDLDIIVVKDSEGVNAPIEFAKKVKEEFGDNIYE